MLLGSHNEETALKFIRDNNLVGKAGYFYTHYEHDSWYVVLYGVYKDKLSALKAAQQLPHYPGTNKPWVRSIASVHEDMQRASPLFSPGNKQ
jgi:DamX protein